MMASTAYWLYTNINHSSYLNLYRTSTCTVNKKVGRYHFVCFEPHRVEFCHYWHSIQHSGITLDSQGCVVYSDQAVIEGVQ